MYNVLLVPDICDRLFSIITLMSVGHNFLFLKGFCTLYFGDKEKNAVTFPHSAQRKYAFLGKIKQIQSSLLDLSTGDKQYDMVVFNPNNY